MRVRRCRGSAPALPESRAPPLSLHLHYRNHCAIISRALISSSQGGYMVNTTRASATHTTTPPSTRRSKISHRRLVSVLPAISNRHKLQLESSVTSRKQTTAPNSNRHKFCPKSARALRPPAATTHQSPPTPFLFDTNKTHRIIILLSALLKTKDKQFSIRYKFAVGSIGNPACALRSCIRALRNDSNQMRTGRIAYATAFLASVRTAVLLSSSEVDHERQ